MATVDLNRDLLMALDRVEFARSVGLPDLDPWQEKVLRSGYNRLLLNASRQVGKSTIVAVLALHTALYKPGSFVLVFGPSQDQSLEFFRKVSGMYETLGEEAVDPESSRKLGIELNNGSRVEARPGSEKTARGRTADLIVIDEAAYVDDQLYLGLRPSLAVTGGTLAILSTPRGKRGFFHDEWEHREERGWDSYKIDAYQCPRIPITFLEREKTRGERYFSQEYLCQFVETEDQVFSDAIIAAAIDDDVVPLWED